MRITEKLRMELEEILSRYEHKTGAILPMLYKVQERVGYLSQEILEEMAERLRIPAVDLFEVATFYTLLNTEPVGKHIIRVCENISCYLWGAENLLDFLQEELGVKVGETTADRRFTLKTTSCLGACDRAPVMMVNETLYDHLTPERIREILSKY